MHKSTNDVKLGRIVLLDTFKTTGTGPFSKYLFPASHKERVLGVASSRVAPAEQLGFPFLCL